MTKEPDVGDLLLGRYRVVRRLARGGQGTVFLARTEGAAGFIKPVVVKCMLPHLVGSEEHARLVVREAHLLAALRHPGIVNVLDFAEEEGAYTTVLDYVHGYNLGKWLRYSKECGEAFPVSQAVSVLALTLDALEYAHGHRGVSGEDLSIVHRDVSPANIIVDVDGRVKLADFGIARSTLDRTETGDRRIKGNFPYVAPELLGGDPPSPVSDVYAAGVVLYEALSGNNPFRCKQLRSIVIRAINHVPPRLDELREDVSAALADVVAKAMDKDPEHRHASAGAFAAALRSARREDESAAARGLAARASEDFRCPDFSVAMGLPALDELEHAWNRDASELAAATDGEGAEDLFEDETVSATPVSALPPSALSPSAPLPSARPTVGSKRSGVRRSLLGAASVLLVATSVTLGLSLAPEPTPAVAPVVVVSAYHAPPTPELEEVEEEPPLDSRLDSPSERAGVDESEPQASTDPEHPAERSSPARTPRRRGRAARLTGAFARRQGRVTACFRQHPEPQGGSAIVIQFRVGTAGSVASATVEPANVAATALGSCLVAVARSTDFPPQPEEVSFHIPVTVRRQ